MHAILTGLRGSMAGSFVSGALGLWVFSAAVCALSAPDGNSSKAYQWLYRFSHLLAANLDRAGLTGGAQEGATGSQQTN
jgi:hypothetical protein